MSAATGAAPALDEGRFLGADPPDLVARTVVVVDVDDPVFAGHYPGFPILPGLTLVDHAEAPLRRAGLRLVAMDRVRFLSPVYPGDTVTVDVRSVGDPGELRFTAIATGPDGQVSEFRMRCERVADIGTEGDPR